MNGSYVLLRAIRSPLILIALGVLFLVDQSGGSPFYRTWPVLLVLAGALRLLERLIAPEQGGIQQ